MVNVVVRGVAIVVCVGICHRRVVGGGWSGPVVRLAVTTSRRHDVPTSQLQCSWFVRSCYDRLLESSTYYPLTLAFRFVVVGRWCRRCRLWSSSVLRCRPGLSSWLSSLVSRRCRVGVVVCGGLWWFVVVCRSSSFVVCLSSLSFVRRSSLSSLCRVVGQVVVVAIDIVSVVVNAVVAVAVVVAVVWLWHW